MKSVKTGCGVVALFIVLLVVVCRSGSDPQSNRRPSVANEPFPKEIDPAPALLVDAEHKMLQSAARIAELNGEINNSTFDASIKFRAELISIHGQMRETFLSVAKQIESQHPSHAEMARSNADRIEAERMKQATILLEGCKEFMSNASSDYDKELAHQLTSEALRLVKATNPQEP